MPVLLDPPVTGAGPITTADDLASSLDRARYYLVAHLSAGVPDVFMIARRSTLPATMLQPVTFDVEVERLRSVVLRPIDESEDQW
jgi:hypothetical protein